mgnify:CR=1 FL=1
MNNYIKYINKICTMIASMTEDECRLAIEMNENLRKLKLLREIEELKNEI